MYKDPRDACAAIVAESYRLWLQYETRTDDITVIVVHIDGLTDVSQFLLFDFISPFFISFFLMTQSIDFILCQAAGVQSKSYEAVLSLPLPQVVEASGSESPAVMNWNSRNQRARQDISRARLRALENSLENGRIWMPPSPGHRKTWEEEVNNSF